MDVPVVTYEVSVSVPRAASAEYLRYMTTTHIPAIFATRRFKTIQTRSSVDTLIGVPEDADWVHYKTAYVALSTEELKAYFTINAPALREDFMKNVPKDAKVSRRVWSTIPPIMDWTLSTSQFHPLSHL